MMKKFDMIDMAFLKLFFGLQVQQCGEGFFISIWATSNFEFGTTVFVILNCFIFLIVILHVAWMTKKNK